MKSTETVNIAHPHTIKKIDLIASYIQEWAEKLIHYEKCNTLVFIDCMSNSGMYRDENGNLLDGTGVRVSRILKKVAENSKHKNVKIYLNDINPEKVNVLKDQLPQNSSNFHIYTSVDDASNFLKKLSEQILSVEHLHYFLLYDPYDASIDWEALRPYFKKWGEILINHMISDPTRAIKMVKREEKKKKYEDTYLESFEELMSICADKKVFEERVEQIMQRFSVKRKYFIAVFSFHNKRKALLYNLVHGTSNIEGFKLFKKCAWKIFGGYSTNTKERSTGRQICLNFDCDGDSILPEFHTDENCYDVIDIAKYLCKKFSHCEKVPLEHIWSALDRHPMFPSEGFRKEIKLELEKTFKARIFFETDKISKKRKTYVSFI